MTHAYFSIKGLSQRSPYVETNILDTFDPSTGKCGRKLSADEMRKLYVKKLGLPEEVIEVSVLPGNRFHAKWPRPESTR
jgi:hypothetical protein